MKFAIEFVELDVVVKDVDLWADREPVAVEHVDGEFEVLDGIISGDALRVGGVVQTSATQRTVVGFLNVYKT